MNEHDEHVQMVEDCENRSEKLSDWEAGFIDSLGRQLAEGRPLSEKQIDKLDAIWNRIT